VRYKKKRAISIATCSQRAAGISISPCSTRKKLSTRVVNPLVFAIETFDDTYAVITLDKNNPQ